MTHLLLRKELALILALMLFACDRGKSRTETTPVVQGSHAEEERVSEKSRTSATSTLAFPRNDWECTEESVERISAWLSGWDALTRRSFEIDLRRTSLVELDVSRSEPSDTTESLATIALRDGMVFVNDKIVERLAKPEDNFNPRTLLEALIEAIQRSRQRRLKIQDGELEISSILLAVDQDVPVARVSRAVQVATRAGIDRVGFVVKASQPSGRIEHLPDDIVERLVSLIPQRFDPEQPHRKLLGPSQAMRDASREVVEDCPQMINVHQQLMKLVPDNRWKFLSEHLGDAWLACECRADIEFLVATKIYRGAYRILASTVEMDATDALAALQTHGDTTWGEVAGTLVE